MLTYSERAVIQEYRDLPIVLVESSEGLIDPSISAAVVALDWSQIDQFQHTGVLTPEFSDGTFWDVRSAFIYEYSELDEEKRRQMMRRVQDEAVYRFRRSFISANLPPALSQQSRLIDFLAVAPLDEICGANSGWDSSVQQVVYGSHQYPVGIVGVHDIGVVGSVEVPGRFSVPQRNISYADLAVQPVIFHQTEESVPAL